MGAMGPRKYGLECFCRKHGINRTLPIEEKMVLRQELKAQQIVVPSEEELLLILKYSIRK